MNRRPIIIDTDPGIDDAVAIAIALFSEELDVRLITTVAGNVSLGGGRAADPAPVGCQQRPRKKRDGGVRF